MSKAWYRKTEDDIENELLVINRAKLRYRRRTQKAKSERDTKGYDMRDRICELGERISELNMTARALKSALTDVRYFRNKHIMDW